MFNEFGQEMMEFVVKKNYWILDWRIVERGTVWRSCLLNEFGQEMIEFVVRKDI